VDSAGTPLVAARTPRGIRKRVAADGSIRWQVRYLVRDAASPSGWVETSSTFGTLRPARPRHGSLLSHEAAAKGWCEAAEADERPPVKASVVSAGAARQGLGGRDVGARGRRGRAWLPRATLAGWCLGVGVHPSSHTNADLWSAVGRWIRDTPSFEVVSDGAIWPAQTVLRRLSHERLQALLKPVSQVRILPGALTADAGQRWFLSARRPAVACSGRCCGR